MSGNPPSDQQCPSTPTPPSEGAEQGRPQQTGQARPPPIPPEVWAQLMAGGIRPPGLMGIGVGAPMPIFLPGAGGAVAQTQQIVQLWQGQYPPPEAIEHYERVLPGSFDRMIGMAERLQAAQIDESRRAHDYTHSDNRRGHWLGFFTAVFAMVCALGALALNYPWVSGVFISVPVMGVARALIESVRKPSSANLFAAAAGQPSQGTAPAPASSPPQPAS